MIKRCLRQRRFLLPGNVVATLALLFFFTALTPHLTSATIPDWLRQASQVKLPSYKFETDGVILLDEQSTIVKDNGEITTMYRRAYKVLRPGGRRLGTVAVPFDRETRINYLKGWSITLKGKQYQVTQKDALETGALSQTLYEDKRYKILTVPGCDSGAVVGYEYEQRQRPYVLQGEWLFQNELPVRRSRFSLRLPTSWALETNWANHTPIEQQSAAGQTTWEAIDVPEIEVETKMPHWRSVAGRLVVNYLPPDGELRRDAHTSWKDVGAWAFKLISPQRDTSPALKERVRELTAGSKSTIDKIRALSGFVQRDVRYVAIEIGIGGFRPHRATEVLDNRFGDCKDKATLLSSMLREVGIDSYYVLINTERGYLKPNIPSALSFNHMVLAIKLPQEIDKKELLSVVDDPKLGPLLIFDPTAVRTPLGSLPWYEQENFGLIVSPDGGELRNFPLLAPEMNKLIRTAQLELTAEGSLSGTVQEVRTGAFASAARTQLLGRSATERMKVIEGFVGSFVENLRITDASFTSLEDDLSDLVLSYSFVASDYGKNAGLLLILKPRVLGEKSYDVIETAKERKYPVEFESASVESDVYEIKLPSGYEVDETPASLKVDREFARYSSKTEIVGDTLKYSREYLQKQVFVLPENFGEVRDFYQKISSEERNTAVLRKKSAD